MTLDTNSSTAIKPYTIGIAGGSGAGKTTLSNAIIERIGKESVLVIEHDSYYKDLQDLPEQDPLKNNFDHPNSLDTDLLVYHLRELRAGRSVDIPRYDFSNYRRLQTTLHVEPHPVIIIEGILIFVDEALRNELDIRLYIELNADERFMRRLERDVKERDREAVSVIKQYRDTVRPMHEEFVEPSRQYADFIVSGEHIGGEVVKAVAGLALSRSRIEEASLTITLERLQDLGSQLLSSYTEHRELLQSIARESYNLMRANEVTLHQYDESTHEFRPSAKYSVVWPLNREPKSPRRTGLTTEVFKRGIYIVESRDDVPPHLLESLPKNVQAFIGILLKGDDENIGVLFFNFWQPRKFGFSERNTSKILGNFAALALQISRARSRFEQLRTIGQQLFRSNKDGSLTSSVPVVLEMLAREFNANSAVVLPYIEEEDRFLLEQSYVWPPDRVLDPPSEDGNARKVLSEGIVVIQDRSELPPDLQKKLPASVQTYIGIRLDTSHEKLGVLYFNFTNRREFTKSDKDTAQSWAEQMTAAIWIQRLIEQNTVKERARAEAEDAMLMLTANVVHDIKGMVGYIRWNAKDIIDEGTINFTDRQRSKIERVYKKSEETIQQLEIRIAAMRTPTPALVSLESLLQYMVSNLPTNLPENIDFVINLPQQLPKIYVDSVRVTNAFFGLVINAKEAIERGGREHGRIEITAQVYRDFIEVLFINNGPSIPESKWEDIFRGLRLDAAGGIRKGTGSGLHIARALVEAQGGNIRVLKSTDDQTVFAVALPVVANQEQS